MYACAGPSQDICSISGFTNFLISSCFRQTVWPGASAPKAKSSPELVIKKESWEQVCAYTVRFIPHVPVESSGGLLHCCLVTHCGTSRTVLISPAKGRSMIKHGTAMIRSVGHHWPFISLPHYLEPIGNSCAFYSKKSGVLWKAI